MSDAGRLGSDRLWRRGEQLFRRCAKQLEPGARVFEVGAGLGCTVKCFDLDGFSASGIEPGMQWQEFSQSKLRADVRQVRLEDLGADAVNDLVLMLEGHEVEFLEPKTRLIEIKQGPFPGTDADDKVDLEVIAT